VAHGNSSKDREAPALPPSLLLQTTKKKKKKKKKMKCHPTPRHAALRPT
jgi:hypothetical protein